MSKRANPFADLSDFTSQSPGKPVSTAAIDEIAHESGFPSRQARAEATTQITPPPILRQTRRYTTGRNRQINIKATDETISALYRIADDLGVPLGAVLDLALNALQKTLPRS